MRPLRAARSSSLVAASLEAGGAWGSLAFLSAVRRAERCARLRTVAARDLRMFFLAEAIFGTYRSRKKGKSRYSRTYFASSETYGSAPRKSRRHKALTLSARL